MRKIYKVTALAGKIEEDKLLGEKFFSVPVKIQEMNTLEEEFTNVTFHTLEKAKGLKVGDIIER